MTLRESFIKQPKIEQKRSRAGTCQRMRPARCVSTHKATKLFCSQNNTKSSKSRPYFKGKNYVQSITTAHTKLGRVVHSKTILKFCCGKLAFPLSMLMPISF